jgi:hypothetical protein
MTTKPDAKKHESKPEPAADTTIEAAAEPRPATPEPQPATPSVPVAAPEPPAAPAPIIPPIDGAIPDWAVSSATGARHITYTAHDHITAHDLAGTLGAQSVLLPGHNTAHSIAARTITPPKLRPARVTFTFRENIAS